MEWSDGVHTWFLLKAPVAEFAALGILESRLKGRTDNLGFGHASDDDAGCFCSQRRPRAGAF